jgi:uncharacterized membrane protein
MCAVQTERSPFPAAFVIGFASSGFFDGVLLHQILQWHHLLSLVEVDAVRRLQAQILADGLFHALMYVVAAIGLVLLWRSRRGLAAPGGSRRLWSGVLIGFGAWNVLDIALFHWILEIHHVRLDVANPIAWDVGWLLVLGVTPLVAGVALTRRGPPSGKGGIASAALVLLLTAGAGTWSLRPPPASADTLVLFHPGVDLMSAVVAADARLVQSDASGSVAILRLPQGASAWRLYRHGALLVQGASPAGCLAWSRSAPAKVNL